MNFERVWWAGIFLGAVAIILAVLVTELLT